MTTTTKRHIGKCPGCKRVFSVLAGFVDCVGASAFPGFDGRLTRGGNTIDAVFLRDDGCVMAGCTNGRSPVIECDCAVAKFGVGFLVELARVTAVLKPDHVCNAKCTASKGHVCECSCGGKNHGASFSA